MKFKLMPCLKKAFDNPKTFVQANKAIIKKFKEKKTTKEAFKVIMHDLEYLELKKTKDNQYHYNELIKNLKDIFEIKNGSNLNG